MARIKEWIRGKISSKPQRKAKQQEAPPFLPAARPVELIPKPAREGDIPESSRTLQNYGLFGHVPLELRRQILVEAFGGRRIHMDLSYRHPLVRKSRNAQTSEPGSSAEAARRHCGLGVDLVPDDSRPKEWQWFSCVCHRRAGYSELEKQQRYEAHEFSETVEPCDDKCLEGSEFMCICIGAQSDNDDTACFVGAMGWLLACRQA